MLITNDPPPPFDMPDYTDVFSSTLDEKNRVREELVDLLLARSVITDSDLFWCRLVIDEALVNAVVHGNHSNPEKKVFADIIFEPDAWIIQIRDEGSGFSEENIPSLDDDESLMLEHGRGVNLIRYYMDDVTYYSGGNVLVMAKRKE